MDRFEKNEAAAFDKNYDKIGQESFVKSSKKSDVCLNKMMPISNQIMAPSAQININSTIDIDFSKMVIKSKEMNNKVPGNATANVSPSRVHENYIVSHNYNLQPI